jgi:hypothetical protein
VWECSDAVAAGQVDWRLEIGTDCPICGGNDCWREIAPYERKVIELMPYREGIIEVARFQCRTTGKTFSLLPYWLAPYHQYTVRSILIALLLAAAAQENGIGSLFCAAETCLEGDCRANGFLLDRWLQVCLSGMHREHAELARWAALDVLRSGLYVRARLEEVAGYCQGLGIRGPPGIRGLDEVLERHARTTGRFLFGTASQQRGAP